VVRIVQQRKYMQDFIDFTGSFLFEKKNSRFWGDENRWEIASNGGDG